MTGWPRDRQPHQPASAVHAAGRRPATSRPARSVSGSVIARRSTEFLADEAVTVIKQWIADRENDFPLPIWSRWSTRG